MKFSADDYGRGLLYWDIPDAILWVTSASSRDTRDEWSEGLVLFSGSVVPVPSRPFQQLSFVPGEGEGAVRPPYQVRWESLAPTETHIVTRIWDDVTTPAQILHFVPNFGTFHRLVVSTPLLGWPDDAVLRSGDAVVRLVNGPIIGERISDIESVVISQEQVQAETERMGTIQVVGRFIEITAPGSTPEIAEHAAFAFLGYVAACLGDHAVGDVVFSESYTAGADGVRLTVPIPTVGLTPWPVEAQSVDALVQGFPAVVTAIAENRALAIALRWYEQGVRVHAPLDKLLAYFVGLEAIVTEFGARYGPLPIVAERQKEYAQLLAELAQRVQPDVLNSIKSRLIEPSIMDRFRFYIRQRQLDESLVRTFRTIRDVRNDVFHGASVAVSPDLASDAQRLLGALLRTEVGVTAQLPWEQSAQILGARMTYLIAPSEAPGQDVNQTDELGRT